MENLSSCPLSFYSELSRSIGSIKFVQFDSVLCTKSVGWSIKSVLFKSISIRPESFSAHIETKAGAPVYRPVCPM